MYIPKNQRLQVFNQTNSVLKDEGRFLLWDLKIPGSKETTEPTPSPENLSA
jgi:hypothetical protein